MQKLTKREILAKEIIELEKRVREMRKIWKQMDVEDENDRTHKTRSDCKRVS